MIVHSLYDIRDVIEELFACARLDDNVREELVYIVLQDPRTPPYGTDWSEYFSENRARLLELLID